MPVLQAGLGEDLGRPRRPVCDRRDRDDGRAGILDGPGGVERGGAGRRRVLDDEHAAPLDGRALDPLLQPVRLAGLAHDERVESPTLCGTRVEHRGGDRVRAEGQAPDRVDVEVLREVEHHPADEGRRLAVEGHPAQVDVVVGLPARRQRHPPVDDGLVADDLEQAGAVGRDVGHDDTVCRARGRVTCHRMPCRHRCRRPGRFPPHARQYGQFEPGRLRCSNQRWW